MNMSDVADAINASNDWADLMTIKNAVEKRLYSVHAPKLTPAQVRAKYKPGMSVVLVGLRDSLLNGEVVEVVEVLQTKLVVAIQHLTGQTVRTRIPAICAVPVR